MSRNSIHRLVNLIAVCALTVPAFARYRPSNFASLPELRETGASDAYIVLTANDYKVTGGRHSLTERCSEGDTPLGALRVQPSSGDTVTLWFDGKDVSIVAQGASAISGKGGGAGIYLPAGKTLILRRVDDGDGVVKVQATGGNGASAAAGTVGGDGTSGHFQGDGGAGGKGACAGGAGIGGNGGNAGAGGGGGDGDVHPKAGSAGSAGGDGAAAGTLVVFDGIEVTANPGGVGLENQTGGGGGKHWNAYGGGGGGGGGGGSGYSASIGGGAGGGGGGGGGGGACNHGGCGGGGGGIAGGGGTGGSPGTGAKVGANGSASSGDDGGAGGSKSESGYDGGTGGAGGSIGSGGAKGQVLCYDKSLVNAGTTGVAGGSTKALGHGSDFVDCVVTFDFNATVDAPAAGQSKPDEYTLLGSDKKLRYDVQPPSRTGYTFAGYYDQQSGGTQMYSSSGARTYTGVVNASTFYAHWTAVAPIAATATVTSDPANTTATATWTTLPANEDTYGTWYYRTTSPQGPWKEYSGTEWSPVGPLADNRSSTIHPLCPEYGASGEYEFRFELVSVSHGSGLVVTNANVTPTAVFDYIRRDPPTYDAKTKTVYANGSALKIRRDPRDADSVVVFFDQDWDGVYEDALPRAYALADGGWLNGGFASGLEVGGGVRITFESGYVHGVDMGANVAPGTEKTLVGQSGENYGEVKNP